MPSIPDPLNNIRDDLKKDDSLRKEREMQERFSEMNLMQILQALNKKSRDSKEKKLKLMAMLQNLLNSFKKDSEKGMTSGEASDISKAGNSDHGSSAKNK